MEESGGAAQQFQEEAGVDRRKEQEDAVQVDPTGLEEVGRQGAESRGGDDGESVNDAAGGQHPGPLGRGDAMLEQRV